MTDGRPCAPPPVVHRQRMWTSDEMSALALSFWESLGDPFRESTRPTAMVMASTPESVALFFALSACRASLVLLADDPRQWPSPRVLPAGTRLVLPPGQSALETHAASRGLEVSAADVSHASPGSHSLPFFTAPGLVMFTSGSTGLPRPTYRTFGSLLAGSTILARALDLPEGAGVIGSLPLDRAYGLNNCVMAATLLGRPLALADRSDPRELLALFGTGSYGYWPGTPVMADVLARTPHSDTRRAPAICIFAGRATDAVSRSFHARFGVHLRQLYGTTETLTITADLAPDRDVRSHTAGRLLSGVTMRIGETPDAPVAAGESGRIWVRSPALAEGYGFAGALASLDSRDGWWASPDAGRMDTDGTLTLLGRLDDYVRTGSGQLVNPRTISDILESHAAVTEAVVGPVETPTGAIVGALVQASSPLHANDLRRHLAASLPRWAQPRIIDVVQELPRLPNGRPDRGACLEQLQAALLQTESHD